MEAAARNIREYSEEMLEKYSANPMHGKYLCLDFIKIFRPHTTG